MNKETQIAFVESQQTAPSLRPKTRSQPAAAMIETQNDRNPTGTRKRWRQWNTLNKEMQRACGSGGPGLHKVGINPRPWTVWPFVQICGLEMMHCCLIGISGSMVLGLKNAIGQWLWVGDLCLFLHSKNYSNNKIIGRRGYII